MKSTLSLLLLLVLVIPIFYFLRLGQKRYNEEIRDTVLRTLEGQFKFCEIVKEDIKYENARFWMVCNGRPFYSTYSSDGVDIELNGWSFLKEDAGLWTDLSNCDFYDSGDSKLIFYCPQNFNSDRLTAKVYYFDDENWGMEKVEEKNFLEVIASDVGENYNFLSECDVKNFSSQKQEGYPPYLIINFDCSGGVYRVVTDLQTVPLSPPILVDSDLSYEERARVSFENSFGIEADSLSTEDGIVSLESEFKNREFSMSYIFEGEFYSFLPFFRYNIACQENEIKECVKDYGNAFLLPPIKTSGDIVFVNESYFRLEDNIIYVGQRFGRISGFWVNTEGVYR